LLKQTVTHQPQLDEGWCNGCADKQAIQQRVEQEEHEELIVGESDTVIQPKHKEENTCYCLKMTMSFSHLTTIQVNILRDMSMYILLHECLNIYLTPTACTVEN